jgi:hypothetical protein
VAPTPNQCCAALRCAALVWDGLRRDRVELRCVALRCDETNRRQIWYVFVVPCSPCADT